MTDEPPTTVNSTEEIITLFEQINDLLVETRKEIRELRELVKAARRQLKEDAEDRTFAQQAQINARRAHDNVRRSIGGMNIRPLPRDRYTGQRIDPLSQD